MPIIKEYVYTYWVINIVRKFQGNNEDKPACSRRMRAGRQAVYPTRIAQLRNE